jgi:hypothetical protein
MAKEAMLSAVQYLMNFFKTRQKSYHQLKDVQLTPNAIMRSIESLSYNLRDELINCVKTRGFYSLLFDESTLVVGSAQLAVIIRKSFSDNSTTAAILTYPYLRKGKTRGEDMYYDFKGYASDINLLLQKRVSVTDGATVMAGSRNEFLYMWRKTTVLFI